MKTLKIILIFFVAILFMAGYDAYCKDDGSNGVTVYGPTVKSTSESAESAPSETESSIGNTSNINQPGEGSKVKIPGPELNASFRVMYEIKGDRIGGTQVSEAVTLPSEAMITLVDPGMGKAFTIVRVEKDGKETLALNISPEHAIGQKLPKGTYRVYPQDPDGTFARDKLTAKVQVGLVGNDVMDPRARGPMYKTEKEQ